MVVLTLSLCQTVVVQRLATSLGKTKLAAIVDRICRETLICYAFACSIGFSVQLAMLRPSPSPATERIVPVFEEMPKGTSAVLSHLWLWIVFALLWLALNVVRIYDEYARAENGCTAKWRKKRRALGICSVLSKHADKKRTTPS